MPWDPDRYHQFQAQRAAPFEDLFALIRVRPRLSVIDLGCGTGELTRQLADRLPGSHVIGLDNSPQMLQRANQLQGNGLQFELGTIETISGTWDLVFSHAAIHWVPNHQTLIPKLYGLVGPEGQLAVQLPSNHRHPAHLLVAELASIEPFASALQGWTRQSPVLGIDAYADLLYTAGATDITVLEKVYPHLLDNADALVDWLSGTTLIPYMERLPENLRSGFTAAYRQRLWEIWPNGPIFYGFRRTLLVATRPA